MLADVVVDSRYHTSSALTKSFSILIPVLIKSNVLTSDLSKISIAPKNKILHQLFLSKCALSYSLGLKCAYTPIPKDRYRVPHEDFHTSDSPSVLQSHKQLNILHKVPTPCPPVTAPVCLKKMYSLPEEHHVALLSTCLQSLKASHPSSIDQQRTHTHRHKQGRIERLHGEM